MLDEERENSPPSPEIFDTTPVVLLINTQRAFKRYEEKVVPVPIGPRSPSKFIPYPQIKLEDIEKIIIDKRDLEKPAVKQILSFVENELEVEVKEFSPVEEKDVCIKAGYKGYEHKKGYESKDDNFPLEVFRKIRHDTCVIWRDVIANGDVIPLRTMTTKYRDGEKITYAGHFYEMDGNRIWFTDFFDFLGMNGLFFLAFGREPGRNEQYLFYPNTLKELGEISFKGLF